jgi:hypothetical protein
MACGFTMIAAGRKGQSRDRVVSKSLLTKPACFRDAVKRDCARREWRRAVASPAQASVLNAVRLMRDNSGGEPEVSREAQKRKNCRVHLRINVLALPSSSQRTAHGRRNTPAPGRAPPEARNRNNLTFYFVLCHHNQALGLTPTAKEASAQGRYGTCPLPVKIF